MANKLETIGVVGAGVMGTGVAQNLAQRGMQVQLIDTAEAILAKATTQIEQTLRFAGMMGEGDADAEDSEVVMARIQTSTDLATLAEVDFVVENTTEKWDIKAAVYPQLDAICRPEVVFAVNTSAISITRVGGVTQRPQQVVGMHFMNPVPLKPMVEVIRGHHTSDETIATAQQFLTQMGKEGVVVEDYPGFVSNRVLMLTVNEAIFLVQDGVSNAEDVDRIFVGCFGHKMGPLGTADLIGLDTILYSLDVLYESYNDPKFRPAPLLKKMVAAGLHGRKSGEGFFKYPTFG
ncbi:3-hydroxyacyl-CoA dehydrogenase NAD-binding domain-containing protein [Opitutaceae bacterium]|nr:3-hydroxyacyl-CoA dehydrogenase NAD-binding domain-containing protein [Opitutaceae bacterium]